jgi:hypothetical protein
LDFGIRIMGKTSAEYLLGGGAFGSCREHSECQ